MRRLVDLEASWIAPWGVDRALGISWRCDRCPGDCWIILFFQNALGGGASVGRGPGEPVYMRDEDTETLEDLTILGRVSVRCWSGHIRWGRVFTDH